jgi:putative FmdB family regulatory protein
MPIYAYRCSACAHTQDILQKIHDKPLTVCPACEQATFVKQVTAAGFQLKGSGWYVTDFKSNDKVAPPPTTQEQNTTEATKPADTTPSPAPATAASDTAT